jgi:dTDP-4-amino-4,6-dideoxygalactose transaminase
VVKFLDLRSQYLSIQHDVDEAISRTLAQTSFIGGPDHVAFDAEFAAFQGAEHSIGVANGTDAIEIALEALDLPAGAEVLVPANSFISSSEAVTRSGLRVSFCEADETTGLIDLADAASRVTERTAAIIAVHLYGQPCDMDALLAFARQYDLRVLEDCAQAHGAEWKGRRVGAIGDIGTFSFYPGKNLGAYGDGGAIVTNDAELARKCRMIANHGRIDKYNHQFEGRNSRLDGLQAAILRAKLPHLDGWVDRRNAVAALYRQSLSDLAGLQLMSHSPDVRHAYHLFVVRCAQRDALQQHLKADGIETGIHYPIALPDLAAYDYLREGRGWPRASANARQLLSLPIGEHLSDGDVEKVVASVRRFFA